MYYDLCNGSLTTTIMYPCDENNSKLAIDEDWPLERVVSMVVPVCFGVIGLAGLLGNILVVVGEYNYLN